MGHLLTPLVLFLLTSAILQTYIVHDLVNFMFKPWIIQRGFPSGLGFVANKKKGDLLYWLNLWPSYFCFTSWREGFQAMNKLYRVGSLLPCALMSVYCKRLMWGLRLLLWGFSPQERPEVSNDQFFSIYFQLCCIIFFWHLTWWNQSKIG